MNKRMNKNKYNELECEGENVVLAHLTQGV